MKWTKYQRKACGITPLYLGDDCYKKDSRYKEWREFKEEHGFYPFEVYQLDETIVTFILPRLVYFRDNFAHKPLHTSKVEYEAELDNYIKAFRTYLTDSLVDYETLKPILHDFIDRLPHLWM